MDIRYLRSFCLVAQYLNFSKAAKHLYMGQSAISKQIADLEEMLGAQLFVRNKHAVRLTPAGSALLKEAPILISHMNEVIEKIKKVQKGIIGSLKIGCFWSNNDHLPQIIKKFSIFYPEIYLDIRILSYKEIYASLEDGSLDVGLTYYSGNLLPSKYIFRTTQQSQLCFLLPRHHPYANETVLDFADLRHERFLALSHSENPAAYDWIISKCEEAGFMPKLQQLSRMEAAYWHVAAGLGISFVTRDPVFTRMINLDACCIVDIAGDDSSISQGIIWRADATNPAIPIFVKELESICSESR